MACRRPSQSQFVFFRPPFYTALNVDLCRFYKKTTGFLYLPFLKKPGAPYLSEKKLPENGLLFGTVHRAVGPR